MKRTICLFAAVAAIFAVMVSCGKEKLGNVSENTAKETVDYSDDPMRVITVTIPKGDTKMAFEENAGKLRRSFSESDIDQCFIGCTKVEGTYKSFAYQITSVEDVVDATTIKLSKVVGEQGVPSDAAGTVVNFVYAPGHDSVDESGNLTSFDGNKLNLDLSNQTEGAIPAVMFASGTVENHSVTLNFENIAAVLEIKDYSMSSDAEDWTSFGSVTVDALTKGTLTIKDDGTYELGTCEAGKAAIAVSEERTKGAPVFVAMLPGSNVDIKARFNDVVAGNEKIGNFDWAPASKVNVSENGFVRIKEKTFDFAPAAKIGEQKFGYVSKAFAAAQTGDVITILNDCTADASLSLLGGVSAKDAPVVLDMNGKTLVSDGANRINLSVGMHMKITDSSDEPYGKIIETNSDYNVIQLTSENSDEDKASLVVEKISVSGGARAIMNKGAVLKITSGAFTGNSANGIIRTEIQGAETTIVGGDFYAPDKNKVLTCDNTVDLSISGGNFTTEGPVVIYDENKYVTVNIDGGTFNNDGSDELITSNSKKHSVSGGSFTGKFNTDFLAAGYVFSDEQEDGYWIVKKGSESKFEINGEEYSDVKSAMAVANGSSEAVTVKLLTDVRLSESMVVSNENAKITFDLDGKAINFDGKDYNLNISSTNVEILNGKLGQLQNGTGSGEENLSKVIYNDGGTLSIVNVEISGITTSSYSVAIYLKNQSNLTISGSTKITAAKCIQSVSLDSEEQLCSVLIKDDADLNSTYSGTGTDSYSGFCFRGGSYSKLVVENGTLTANATSSAAAHTAIYCSGDKEVVQIKGGKITSNKGYGIHAYSGCDLQIDGGYISSDIKHAVYMTRATSDAVKPKLTITGGTIEAKAEGTAGIYPYTLDSDCNTISGGIISSLKGPAVYLRGNVLSNLSITGGQFSGYEQAIDVTDGGALTVSGGYFSHEVVSKYVKPGYVCVKSSDVPGYSYTVVVNEDKDVIQVGDNKYETVAEGIAAANLATAATTIKLLQNIEVKEAISFTTTALLTLDLNNCTITASNAEKATPAILMDEEGVNITIVDNSADGDGAILQSFAGEAFAIIVKTGTLNIESGTVGHSVGTGYGRMAIDVSGAEGKAAAKVNISGGYIYGGRAIRMGSGLPGIVPEVNITGGVIEGKYSTNNDKTYQYGTLAFVNEYYVCNLMGGTVISDYGPCFYTNRSNDNSTFNIGSATDQTKIPFLYTKRGTWCLRSGGSSASGRVFVYNVYCNVECDNKNSVMTKSTNAKNHTLNPKVADALGNEYGYQIYPDTIE